MKLFVLLMAAALAACFPAEPMTPAHEQVAARFKGEDEPTAKDAMWTSPHVFKVGVLDNRQNRDGYAAYVCEVVVEAGLDGKDIEVQVVDIVSVAKGDRWRILGRASCR